MDLDAKTILQVNASLITGLFIFLSFTSIAEVPDIGSILRGIQTSITLLLMIPFALSAIVTIRGDLKSSDVKSLDYRRVSLRMLLFGIFSLLVGLVSLAGLNTFLPMSVN